MIVNSGVGTPPWFFLTFGLRLIVLLIPGTLLAVSALGQSDPDLAALLTLGAVLEYVVVALLMAYHRRCSPPLDAIVLVCYLAALTWHYYSVMILPPTVAPWYLPMAQAVLIIVPLGIMAAYMLQNSGALVFHRAYQLARSLQARTRWPKDLEECRQLPEVKALRDAIQFEATPALQLLNDHRAEVRMCALGALEFRKRWRSGQAETVLFLLQHEEHPDLRAAAIGALANIEDQIIVQALAHSLRDPDPRVRSAAVMALFWNAEGRWLWMRAGVRRALSEPSLARDGPLLHEGQKLPPNAVDDLKAWCSEKGTLSVRSAKTLVMHYSRVLYERPEDTSATIAEIVTNVHAPPLLRIDLAQLLRDSKALSAPVLQQLLDTCNPAPLRLLGADGLLELGPHPFAVAGLRELARLPNRDLALSTATIVQHRLGVDLGLAPGQPLPSVNGSRAIEITRRLMAWAAQHDRIAKGPAVGTAVAIEMVPESQMVILAPDPAPRKANGDQPKLPREAVPHYTGRENGQHAPEQLSAEDDTLPRDLVNQYLANKMDQDVS
jgi:hypothetical protein